MDEIEYKLNTNNSVLIVNAIDKLISAIKSKFKPAERQKFVLENEELKVLREKCSSKEVLVSLTACQGLLALVELGVLEIAHTMSTVVTLLPSAHNYSAIISTMTGLLILDLKSRLIPGQAYKCQFSLKSPQHPFITVLEKNKRAEDDVIAQMQALCTHADYTVSSNSLELLRPVFLYLTCNPQREGSLRPWQLLLSLPQTDAQRSLLLACLSCQQTCNPTLIERAFSAYCAVADAAIYQKDTEYITALLPMLARISNELVRYGRDPRPCYRLIERCLSLGSSVRAHAGVTLHLLADNLPRAAALYLGDTFIVGLSIITNYEVPSISLNTFVAQTLQWLHLPSHLTTDALKTAAKILDIYQRNTKEDTTLNIPNLLSNKIFQYLLHTDSHLSVIVKLHSTWEKLRDDQAKLSSWFDRIESINDSVKVQILSFFYGVIMGRYNEDIVLKVLKMVVKLVEFKKEISVGLLPVLVYKIANEKSPVIRLECLKALPLMAKTKENVPTIVSILNKLKVNKGVPTSLLIMLYTSLAETQVRCFPYLQEVLAETGPTRPDDLKWEVDIAKILAVKRMCQLRASTHGLELVSIISSTLNRCGSRSGCVASCIALQSVALLWHAGALAPHAAWRALEPALARDTRPEVQVHICALLGSLPSLPPTPHTVQLSTSACRRLWLYVADGTPEVVEAACQALGQFGADCYALKDVPEIYRKTVKLPAAYCKTPADAARRPEDVLDYVPSEVWPEVFKYTNQAALSSVVSLARKLIEREVKQYRSGVYKVEANIEPTTCGHLPVYSVVRGVLDGYRKQISNPSFDCPEVVSLAMLETLGGPFPRPLPPVDLHFLMEAYAKGGRERLLALKFAGAQAQVSPSAKSIVENWVLAIQGENVEVFRNLPVRRADREFLLEQAIVKQWCAGSKETDDDDLCKVMAQICATKRPTRGPYRRHKFWWTEEIADLRIWCVAKRRALQRSRRRKLAQQEEIDEFYAEFKEAARALRQAISNAKEGEILLFYELLPSLSLSLPPNSLRPALERTLADSFSRISHTKAKQDYAKYLLETTMKNVPIRKQKTDDEDVTSIDIKTSKESIASKESETRLNVKGIKSASDIQSLFDDGDSLFEKQLKLVKRCLDCDNIHNANRTLLSQLVEHYFSVIADDNVAWLTYVQTCTSLSSKYLERMTSPSGWWEVTGELLRKAAAVRCAVAAVADGREPLAWLNEIIDAQANEITCQEVSLWYMFPALLAQPASAHTRDWFLQLMARAHRAFTECEEQSGKLYMFSVLTCVVVTWSGAWALEPHPAPPAPTTRLPLALALLTHHTAVGNCTLQILEWLCSARGLLGDAAGQSCQRALLALRHAEPFVQHRIWTKLESHFGKDIIAEV